MRTNQKTLHNLTQAHRHLREYTVTQLRHHLWQLLISAQHDPQWDTHANDRYGFLLLHIGTIAEACILSPCQLSLAKSVMQS